MRRDRVRTAALAVGVVLALGATACTGTPPPEDPSGSAAASSTDAAPVPQGTNGTRDVPGTPASPDATTSAPDDTVPGPSDGPTAPEVLHLTGAPSATPLVPRPGWQVVGSTGACVLSWRGAAAPDAPAPSAREASVALLAQTAAEDGADLVGAPSDVLLPLASDGVRVQGVNGVAQGWTVGTPRGDVHVRGAARVASVPTFDGGAAGQSVVLALDCVGSLDEAAWQGLLDDVRVGLSAPLEELGAWPSR